MVGPPADCSKAGVSAKKTARKIDKPKAFEHFLRAEEKDLPTLQSLGMIIACNG